METPSQLDIRGHRQHGQGVRQAWAECELCQKKDLVSMGLIRELGTVQGGRGEMGEADALVLSLA